jgi:hypothetical protein
MEIPRNIHDIVISQHIVVCQPGPPQIAGFEPVTTTRQQRKTASYIAKKRQGAGKLIGRSLRHGLIDYQESSVVSRT